MRYFISKANFMAEPCTEQQPPPPEAPVPKTDNAEIAELLRRLLAEHQAADHVFTNRMIRGVCQTLIVTQITVMLTALGTGIGALLHVRVPFKGAAWGMIIGWSLGMLYVVYQKYMSKKTRSAFMEDSTRNRS